ncbi:MAG: class I SAM-dependent methyltransferase [Desulfomonile tiedjei]|uniref:Class I SAM-dependent methyltransferase n=1 Tax=Desulfomonile tiedjei TaxID=2358 RepID=A0A9D6V2H4_9BACT|nr:class I SAM-dependent methyltransferase [Desulfomonile tiedjei]
MSIKAGGHYFQRVHDLSSSNSNLKTDTRLRSIADYYELPYKIYGSTGFSVAVVGAGTGNDVAAALRSGAKHVDAIEIDPAILELGKLYHPEQPYQHSRVRTVVTDARTFMRETDDQYDLIVYGLLDSHTLLSHASSVRLDSFVYTVEGLEEARRRLKPGGLMSLSFCVLTKEMGRKIYLMMKQAMGGKGPVCIQAGYDGSVIYLQRRDQDLTLDGDLLKKSGFRDITDETDDEHLRSDISTDDWPFFYMPKRVFPISYLGILGIILFLSVTVTYNFVHQGPTFGNWSFFFLGAGFMLVETKAITELGLAFGNTWHVIGIVISCILLMAFLANYAVRFFVLKSPVIWFVFLLSSLAIGFLSSTHGGFGSSISGKALSVMLLTCPIFFSGVVFSTLLREAKDISSVMAINLIGAITGGILEYNSMYFGFGFLYLLAIALYLLAFSFFYVKRKLPQSAHV